MRPYPFDLVRRIGRADAAVESAVARWIAARPGGGGALARLAGGPVRAEVVRAGRPPAGGPRPDAPIGALGSGDPHAARCELRIGGMSLDVRGSSAAVRHLAQRRLGGPDELAAPRPLGLVEHAVWALAVAAALEDLGVGGEVWPHVDGAPPPAAYAIELAVELAGVPLTVLVLAPRAIELRAPPPMASPAWTRLAMLDVPVVVGRCALPAAALAGLGPRDVVTLERPRAEPAPGGGGAGTAEAGGSVAAEAGGSGTAEAGGSVAAEAGGSVAAELEIFGGVVGVRGPPGALVAEVATGYVPRDMSLPDDAHVELTVALGTTRLSLRQVFELAIGQVVPLGRPLAGPFELRAAGRVVGQGELVDVDGELGVRIVSLAEP